MWITRDAWNYNLIKTEDSRQRTGPGGCMPTPLPPHLLFCPRSSPRGLSQIARVASICQDIPSLCDVGNCCESDWKYDGHIEALLSSCLHVGSFLRVFINMGLFQHMGAINSWTHRHMPHALDVNEIVSHNSKLDGPVETMLLYMSSLWVSTQGLCQHRVSTRTWAISFQCQGLNWVFTFGLYKGSSYMRFT